MQSFTYTFDSGAWSEDSKISVPPNRIVGYEFTSTASAPIGSHNVSLVDNSTLMNISNYISNGAGVNVPSESLGFYFSGAVTPDLGQIDTSGNASSTATNLSSSMIQINMSIPGQPTALNLTLPHDVPPRANAEIVWVPVSSQGILIAIGGVTNLTSTVYITNISESSPSINFMASLSVYDIASQTWFPQNTSGGPPPPRTQFCAITTNATNSSSFEIFIFGGNTGNSSNLTSFGDVWALSVPSFTWTQVFNESGGTKNRDTHICVLPYPDQMFVIGGENLGNSTYCVDTTIEVFNLTNSTWMDFYDPTIRSEYQIPSAVVSNIAATPTASNMNPSLLALFQQPYQNYIPTYYPYATAPPKNTSVPKPPRPSHTPVPPPHNNHLGAILGSVLGALGLAIIVLAIWCLCVRKSGKSGKRSRGRITSWVKGVDKTGISDATTEVDDAVYEADGHATEPARAEVEGAVVHPSARAPRAEADGSQRYEMLAMGPGSPEAPIEMPTSYHLRDHPMYPRNPAGTTNTKSLTHDKSSTDGPNVSAPSPPANPQDGGVSNEDSSQTKAPSPQVSPPLDAGLEHRPSHKRNLSSTSSGIPVSASSEVSSPNIDGRVSELGHSTSRPGHARNLSSMSSGVSPQSPTAANASAGRELQSPLAVTSPALEPARQDEVAKPSASTGAQPGSPTPGDGPGPSIESSPLISQQALQGPSEPRNFSRNTVPRKQVPGKSAFKEGDLNSPRTSPAL